MPRNFVKKFRMKIAECEVGVIEFIEQDILLVDIRSGVEVDVEHMASFKSIVDKYAVERKIATLINQGEFSSTSTSARELYRFQSQQMVMFCNAIVVHDLGQKIIAKHLLKWLKIKIPTKIFTELSKAKIWINRMRLN